MEYIAIEVWTRTGNIRVVNFYNPCKKLSVEAMDEFNAYIEGKIICCGDFNAHSTLWGSKNDDNGIVIEEIMDGKTWCV